MPNLYALQYEIYPITRSLYKKESSYGGLFSGTRSGSAVYMKRRVKTISGQNKKTSHKYMRRLYEVLIYSMLLIKGLPELNRGYSSQAGMLLQQ
jgi:hypothetical protein